MWKIGQYAFHTFVCHVNIVATIPRVLWSCSPPAIIFTIWLFVIYPIYLTSVIRSISHIFYKLCKIMPFMANGNSSCTISFIADTLRILASLYHSPPYMIAVIIIAIFVLVWRVMMPASLLPATVDIGDWVNIAEADSSATTCYQIVGLEYDQRKGVFWIELGSTEDYYLGSIASNRGTFDLSLSNV